MKRTLTITVLVVMLMSTVGATTAMAAGPAKTVLSCEPPAVAPASGSPFGIAGTLTSGTSGTPVPHRLITVYTSANANKWTPVGSAYTDDSGRYTVTTSQSAPGTYYYKAVCAGIFTRVTSPTIPVTVVAAGAGGAYYAPLYKFYLNQNGWFVAKIACEYSTDGGVTWQESSHTGGIAIWSTKSVEPGDLGVPGGETVIPTGALVKIHVIVVGGIGGASGKTGSEVFQYFYTPADESHHYAEYTISGTTFKNKLEYNGYSCCLP